MNINVELKNLKDNQARVNGALELMPPSDLKNSFLNQRAYARNLFSQKITPLLKNISDVNPLLKGPLSSGATQSALGYILQANMIETQILSDIDRSLESPVKGAHPFAGEMFGDQAQDTLDTNTGLSAMKYFYDIATSSYPSNSLPASWNDFVDFVNQKSPAFFIGLGGAINSSSIPDATVQAVMSQMADRGQGNMPENWTSFFSALGQAGSDPSFWSALKFTVKQSAVDVSSGLQQEGAALIDAGKSVVSITKYLPWIALGGIALYLATITSGPRSILKGISKHV